jgi:hypothetical protein
MIDLFFELKGKIITMIELLFFLKLKGKIIMIDLFFEPTLVCTKAMRSGEPLLPLDSSVDCTYRDAERIARVTVGSNQQLLRRVRTSQCCCSWLLGDESLEQN